MAGDPWSLKDAKNLREDELDGLFKAAKKAGPQAYLMIILSYNGALRVSELVHIRVSDFHWPTNKISMIPLKKAGKRRKRGADGKMVQIDRDLPRPIEYPLASNVMDLAREYIKKERLHPEAWLFPGKTTKAGCKVVKLNCPGGHICKRKVQNTFDAIAMEAKIKVPGRGIHSLKHARLTEVAKKTKDPYFVKEVGRHSSITMSDHYVKYADFQDRIEKLGGRT